MAFAPMYEGFRRFFRQIGLLLRLSSPFSCHYGLNPTFLLAL